MGRVREKTEEIAYYFGLGDDEPSEHEAEPETRRELIVSLIWLIAGLIVAGVVIDLLAVWALPAPVDFIVALAIAGLAGVAVGAVQLAWDWATGSS
jgi:archaellum biogenesis protein FlaJ (TadC family)